MKRCIKWLINWFTRWVGIGFALGGVVGLVICIISFVFFDQLPATSLDYEQLEKQVIAIQKNLELLLETDCNINVSGKVITINFDNDNCKVTAQYNKCFEMLSSSRKDKSKFWLDAFGFALLIGICAFGIGFLVFALVAFLLGALWELISKTLKLNKNKF